MDQQLGPANTLPADDNPYASNVLLSPDGATVAFYKPNPVHPDAPWVRPNSDLPMTHDEVTGWHPLAPMSLSDTIRTQDGRKPKPVKLPDVTPAEAEVAVAYFASHVIPDPATLNDFVTVQRAISTLGRPLNYVGVTGRERSGEHWNARLAREQYAANRLVAAMRALPPNEVQAELARRHAEEAKALRYQHEVEVRMFNRREYGDCTASDGIGAACGEAAISALGLCATHQGIDNEMGG